MAITMEPRQNWTYQRLDDLSKKVDDGFERLEKKIDTGLTEVKAEIRGVRSEVKGLSAEMNSRFDAMNARFDAFGRNLFMAAIAIVVALIGCSATLGGIAVL